MKKVDFKFLLIQGVALLVMSWIIGIVVSIAMGEGNHIVGAFNTIPLFFFLITLMYVGFGNSFTGTIAKKTMAKNAQKENFRECSTFITDGSFTIGGIVKIDENTGRVAYVSYQNPYEFQMVHAKDFTNIKSDYKKAPLGGTNYVYFEFFYKNKRVRIPTFTSNTVYSLQSEAVLEGISKADAFCDLLTNAQQTGA